MAGVYGRIDWYPYLHTWHVVGYTKGKTPKSIKEVTEERRIDEGYMHDLRMGRN